MPREFNNVGALMRAISKDMKEAVEGLRMETALQQAGEHVKQAAQDKLGHYQGAVGEWPAWPSLANSTQNNRTYMGYHPDMPLYMTGLLHDSIVFSIHPRSVLIGVPGGMAATDRGVDIGDIANYQEFGTLDRNGYIPPRPFLAPALFESREHIGELIQKAIAGFFRSKL